jgi:hypothetical protein
MRLILALIVAVVALLEATAAEAAPIKCRTSAGHDGHHYAWRLIDGRKCWYRGRPGLAKSKLAWSVSKPRPARVRVASRAAPRIEVPQIAPPRIAPSVELESLTPRVIRTVPVPLTPSEVVQYRWIY